MLALCSAIFASFPSHAAPPESRLALPAIECDGAVLERDHANVIGTDTPGSVVAVTIGNVVASGLSDVSGNWRANINNVKGNGPFSMTVTDGVSTKSLHDIKMGEVWIVGGAGLGSLAANDLNVTDALSSGQAAPISVYDPTRPGVWSTAHSPASSHLSATAYVFASELSSRNAGSPVGIINMDTPGVSVETAMSPITAQQILPHGQVVEGDQGPLWRSALSPLTGFSFKGVVWSDSVDSIGDGNIYHDRFPTFIKSWRFNWQIGDFAFFYTQLGGIGTNYSDSPAPSSIAMLREAQAQGLAMPNTTMIATLDLTGEDADVQAAAIAERFVNAAMSKVYGFKGECSGPIYRAMKIENGAIRIHFDHVPSGPIIHGDLLRSFQISGANQEWDWADARIEGKDVIVYNHDVLNPVAVRYAWADNWIQIPPAPNLFNRLDLPAAPFRTDDWPE